MPVWMQGRVAWVLAPLLGAVATLGFAPFHLWPLSVLALVALMALLQGQGTRRGALLGWLFGLGHFATGVYWVFISTHVYGGAAAWLAVLLATALFAYLALYPAVFAAAFARWQWQLGAAAWALVPAAWVLLELLRGWVYSGFPWLSLGYSALDTPLERLAPLLGVHGISAVLVLAAYALLRLAQGPARSRWVALAVLLLTSASALLPVSERWTTPEGAPLAVALVQSSIPQDQKWRPAMRQEALARHWRLTEAAWPADLVIWPEVALTQPYAALADGYLADLEARAEAQGGQILLGILIGEGERYTNSAILLGDGRQRYDKRHLVPFGEYFPVPAFLRPLMDVLDLPYSDFAFGAEQQSPFRVDGHRIAVGICFEDVFGSEVRRDARGSAFLVNITNDAWFGRSSAPWQHLQFSRMRAMETGRWMARTANTGISALIDANGRIVDQAGLFEQAVLKGELQPRSGETPYMRWGDLPLWISAGGLLLAGFLGARRRQSR